ncbi:MAG: hemerythrin domain-containing protein [Candidatus Lernaella stagnicola]|nr:hemerythrin domain-containing protein [Candidatus Lernaella stagnicola]
METKRKMMPIGPLMIEHRLIERMIRRIERELEAMAQSGEADVLFLDRAVDFIRTYADRCHHGKEEDILFRELDKKDLTPEQRRIMEELFEEHVLGRNTVARLVAARNRYADGDATALAEIREALATLVDFYPVHIEKEDKHFFLPVMEHFTQAERDAILQEGFDFDAGLIHEKYKELVATLE